ncbi:MAG TPA: cysteine synthase family protein [Gammaproteobacteria bacterium]|nr:cysteine synthase family protein [Gammaproteobacteria bacterium]
MSAAGERVSRRNSQAVNSILEQIGNTPLLRFVHITQDVDRVEIYGKAEWFNPGGSVKDRAALRMIEEGERSGALTGDKVILDSTSGNTGIAYALIGAVKGYRVELAVPRNVSRERKRILQAFGAHVIYTDPLAGSDGAIREAHRRYEANREKYFMPDQYNNPANWQAHYDTTGPEIIQQTQGRITHFVAGIGTSGTLMGTGRRLREFNPRIQIVAVMPAEDLHGIEGLKHMETAIVPGIWDEQFPDLKLAVRTEDAYAMARRLAQEEGILVGQSAGAVVHAALALARQLSEGVIVTILPDAGDRYFSTGLWEG